MEDPAAAFSSFRKRKACHVSPHCLQAGHGVGMGEVRTRKIDQGNNLDHLGWDGPPKADRDPDLNYWRRRFVLSTGCTTSQTKVTLEPLGVKMAPLLPQCFCFAQHEPPPDQDVAWISMVAEVTVYSEGATESQHGKELGRMPEWWECPIRPH